MAGALDRPLERAVTAAGNRASAPDGRAAVDVAVVGAGLAGSLVARALAQRGLEVALVDRSEHPRWKVCGCCLGARAVAALAAEGLGDLPSSLGAMRPRVLELGAGSRRAEVPLDGTLVLSRTRLDAALVDAARSEGARIWGGWSATLGPWQAGRRTVQLRRGSDAMHLHARLVVGATGLTPLPHAGGGQVPQFRVRPQSRIGVGAVFDPGGARPLTQEALRVRMLAGRGGYVGLSVLEDGALNVAGALDPGAVRRAGGVGAAVAAILEDVGLPAPAGRPRSGWKGTPALTRTALPPGAPGLLLVGDAAGYVEPFTGEGMTWAVESARALVPLVRSALDPGRGPDWDPHLVARWQTLRDRTLGSRTLIRLVAKLTRHPRLSSVAVSLLSRAPALARPLVRRAAGPALPFSHHPHDGPA